MDKELLSLDNLKMKNLKSIYLTLSFLLIFNSCVIPEMAVDIAKEVEIGENSSKSNGPSTNSPISKKRENEIEQDIKSCLDYDSVVREPLDEDLKEVDISFNSDDIENLKNFGEKLNLNSYWNDLNEKSYYEIDMLLIRQMKLLRTEKFNIVKKVIPFGLSHYLYNNKSDLILHILTENKDTPLITLKFGTILEDTEEKITKSCMDFNFNKVAFRNSDHISAGGKSLKAHIRCTNKHNSRIDLKITPDDHLFLDINSNLNKLIKYNMGKLEVINKKGKIKIQSEKGYLAPRELKIVLVKRYDSEDNRYIPQSVFSMDLKRFGSVLDRDSFSNMDCRNIIPLNLK